MLCCCRRKTVTLNHEFDSVLKPKSIYRPTFLPPITTSPKPDGGQTITKGDDTKPPPTKAAPTNPAPTKPKEEKEVNNQSQKQTKTSERKQSPNSPTHSDHSEPSEPAEPSQPSNSTRSLEEPADDDDDHPKVQHVDDAAHSIPAKQPSVTDVHVQPPIDDPLPTASPAIDVAPPEGAARDSMAAPTENRRGGYRGEKIDTNIKIPRYAKTKQESERIRCALMNNEFLKDLIPESEMKRMIAAMSPKDVEGRQRIIEQGEMGTQFYVSDSGSYRVLVGGEIVLQFKDQRVFGELGVLYKNPRAATVQAMTAGRIWVMEGAHFQALLVRTARGEQEKRLNFLKSVPAVKEASEDKLQQIAKLMQESFYKSNEVIIKQGDRGNKFYVIKAGKVRVEKKGQGQVAELGEGQFFGEKALMEADVRQATCIAQPPGVTCLELTRNDFTAYLGDFEDFVKGDRRASAKSSAGRGTAFVEPTDFPAFKDLLEEKVIGIGGFGRVVLVKDIKVGQTYALKMLNKVDNKSKEQREHAINEKRIQMTCQSGFLVHLYATYQNPKYLYFLMEACMGGDLFSLMQRQRGRVFDEDSAQFIAGCTLEAIGYLHEHDFIYRDLKPENLLIDSKGYVKLADFGFAKQLKPGETTFTFAGTPEYVAPEVIYNKGHNRAVDLWAFGIFVFELLVGRTPFKTNDTSYMKTYGLILKGIENIQFPSRLGKNAAVLVKKLCKLTPHERLGCQKRGVEDIREQKWFSSLNWKQLQAQAIPSKFKPTLSKTNDTSAFDNFDEAFDVPEDDNDQEFWKDF